LCLVWVFSAPGCGAEFFCGACKWVRSSAMAPVRTGSGRERSSPKDAASCARRPGPLVSAVLLWGVRRPAALVRSCWRVEWWRAAVASRVSRRRARSRSEVAGGFVRSARFFSRVRVHAPVSSRVESAAPRASAPRGLEGALVLRLRPARGAWSRARGFRRPDAAGCAGWVGL